MRLKPGYLHSKFFLGNNEFRAAEVLLQHPPRDAVTDRLMSNEFSVSGPARRVFARIADVRSLSEEEQASILGQPVGVAFQIDDVSGDIQTETLERVSYLIGIHRALHAIFPH